MDYTDQLAMCNFLLVFCGDLMNACVAQFLRYGVLKSVCAGGDFKHFQSVEQYANGCI